MGPLLVCIRRTFHIIGQYLCKKSDRNSSDVCKEVTKKQKQIVPTKDAVSDLHPIYHNRTERLTIPQDLHIFVRQNSPTL